MALSFKFHNDAGLTTPVVGNLLSEHNIDGSDPHDDFAVYFGSVEAGKKLEANSNPGTDQIALSITHTVPLWTATTAKALNDRVRPNPHNGFKYLCTVAGTTGASQPSWPTTIGATVADGSVTWQCEVETNNTDDVKLAATSGGLAGATWGAGLNLGTQILSGAGNAVPVHLRVRDSTQFIQNTDLSIVTNTVRESVQ